MVKFGPRHAWCSGGRRRCVARGARARATEGTRGALVEGCTALRDSIDAPSRPGGWRCRRPQYERAAEGREGRGLRPTVRDFYQVTMAEVIPRLATRLRSCLTYRRRGRTFAYRPSSSPFTFPRPTGRWHGATLLCSSRDVGDLPAITVKRTATRVRLRLDPGHVTAGTMLDVLQPATTFARGRWTATSCVRGGSGITPVIPSSVCARRRARPGGARVREQGRAVGDFRRRVGRLAAQPPSFFCCAGLTRCRGPRRPPGSRPRPGRPPGGSRTYAGPTVPRGGQGGARAARRAAKHLRAERFLSLAENPFEESSFRRHDGRRRAGGDALVDLDGATRRCRGRRAPMLDVLVAAGLAAPFSCRQGSAAPTPAARGRPGGDGARRGT